MVRDRFEREANALWAQLQSLADATPRLEGLYARDADPRVARAVQSAAFAFAAAQDRLDDDGQALVRPLVARALPECLRPRPSSTIVELAASTGRSGAVPTATFSASAGGLRIPFQTVWPVVRAPLGLRDGRVDRLDARRQVLRFTLTGAAGVPLGVALPQALRFYVHLEPRSAALDLVHALRSSAEPGHARWLDAKGALLAETRLPAGAVAWVRVDGDEAPLVSARADRFRSSSLLRDLLAFPESFCFFDVRIDPGGAGRAAAAAEIVLPLAHVVDGASSLSVDDLRLFCAPATNQYVAEIQPVEAAEASEAMLAVAGRPHAEILEVRELVVASVRDARRHRLRSWECPGEPRTFDPGDVYYALEQRPSPADGRTETHAAFGRLDAFPSSPRGRIEGQVLACDGAQTATIGIGEIGSARDGGTNVSRVTASRRALLGDNHAWRMSAYARMPATRLAEVGNLTRFVQLHDPYGMREAASRIEVPRILTIVHERAHELAGGELRWGDVFELDLDAGGCSAGELWLFGALVRRALAERSEALRFSRVSLRRGGDRFAEYASLPGERVPFPLG